MTQFVVLAKDLREGEDFVIGPFETKALAYTWASDDADEKATEYDMATGRSKDGEGYITLAEGDETEDLIYEWQVMELIQPPKSPYARVRLITGDDLWQGAQPGWYLFPNGDDGDSTGPFDTKEEAEKARTQT